MSRRAELEARLATLSDINKIMRSMKSLSDLETRKLGRFIASQHRVVAGIEAAACDLLDHYPELRDRAEPTATLLILIGAERGFCGGFNETLLRHLEATVADASTRLVAVGHKLSTLLEDDPRCVAKLSGPATAEEVPSVIKALVRALNQLGAGEPGLVLRVLHWDARCDAVVEVVVLPPFASLSTSDGHRYPSPPRLNLAPATFYDQLVDHYLFAALHDLLFSSLMAEHEQRVRHLQGALQRVDSHIQSLGLRRNLLRQEEITEEIELILLNRLNEPAA